MLIFNKIQFFCLFLYCCATDSDICGDSLECVENKLKTFVDNLENEDKIGDLISLNNIGRGNRQIKEKEDFIERCFRFLREHELRIRLPESTGRSLETESRSKRLRKLILPIILLLKLKAAIVIPIVLSLISFLAFTGFKSGLAALAISGAVALKSFIEHHGSSKISYEILPSITSAWSRTGGVEGAVGTVPVTGYQSLN